MKPTTRTKLITLFSTIDAGDFHEAFVLLKEARGRIATTNIATLAVGDVVEFDAGRNRGVLVGTISKLNRTTALVMVPPIGGGIPVRWKVGASLLRVK